MQLLKKHSFSVAGLFFGLVLSAAVLSQQPALLLVPFALLAFYVASTHLSMVWYILVAFLPLSMEFNFTPSLGLNVPDEILQIFLTAVFLILVLLKQVKISTTLIQHPIILLLALAWCWTMVTVCFSTNSLISLKYLLAKSWFIIPFILLPFWVIQTKADLRLVGLLLLIPMFFTVLYTLKNHAQTGFLFDHINNAVVPFFRNHVNYAAMLVCLMPVAGAFYFLSPTSQQKKYIFAALCISIAALFLSYSRGAWLALLVGIIAVFLLQKKILAYSFLTGLAFLLMLLFYLGKNNRYLNYHSNFKKTIYHANFRDHMQATFSGTDMSNAERLNRWIAAIRMQNSHPLTGYGPNCFYDNYKPFTVSYFKTWVSENKEKSTVHNYFLLLLVEQGWPGLALFVLLLFLAFKKTEQLYHRLKDPFYKITILCIGVILSMIVTLNMLSDLIETDKIGSLFYGCLGILLWIDLKNKDHLLQ